MVGADESTELSRAPLENLLLDDLVQLARLMIEQQLNPFTSYSRS